MAGLDVEPRDIARRKALDVWSWALISFGWIVALSDIAGAILPRQLVRPATPVIAVAVLLFLSRRYPRRRFTKIGAACLAVLILILVFRLGSYSAAVIAFALTAATVGIVLIPKITITKNKQ